MKIIFWIVTGLLSLMMLGSAGMYIFNHASVATIFQSLGYPTYIIYPSGDCENSGRDGDFDELFETAERMGVCRIFLRFYFGGFGALCFRHSESAAGNCRARFIDRFIYSG